MSFPLEKYRYYIDGNRVIAVSTYEGKIVRGVALCADEDEFSAAAGKEVAAARCNLRVCQKRKKRAQRKYDEAFKQLEAAQAQVKRMSSYLKDAMCLENEAIFELKDTLSKY